MINASASAKTILFGEHAVVYGYPAIAVPISSLRATAEIIKQTGRDSGIHIKAPDIDKELILNFDAKQLDQINDALSTTVKLVIDKLGVKIPSWDITIQSTIPLASGLGSGAAVSTAIARSFISAFGKSVDLQTLNEIVFEVEKIHHGTPSGVDNTVIVYEKPIYFIRDKIIEPFEIKHKFSLIIADTGHPAPTKIAVSDVRKLYETDKKNTVTTLEAIGKIAEEGRIALVSGDHCQLGVLMTQNHQLLRDLTVSSPLLDKLVEVAIQAGALGAKLSGGGRGGNMIALVTAETQEAVTIALKKAGAINTFLTTLK